MKNEQHTETRQSEYSAEKRGLKLPVVPASAFAMVLGLTGLAGSWRAASGLWTLPPAIGEYIGWVAVAVWATLAAFYAMKWAFMRQEAVEELNHPVQCCFVGLSGVATMLAAGVMQPSFPFPAEIIFWLGAAAAIGYAVWKVGDLWHGGREKTTITAALYLPAVASAYVLAIVGSGAFGYQTLGQMAFGAGFFGWLATESVLLHRLLTGQELPAQLRPTIGIQLAPPSVGLMAYFSSTSGVPDLLAHAMLGYALLQALLMLRILPWVLRQPFAASYWAFTFGATALATAAIKMAERGNEALIVNMAPVIFMAVNLALGLIIVMTVLLLLRGRLFPTRHL